MRFNQAGFSLIELMIATVIGMLLTGAAVTLTVSIIRSNSETIQASRISQELRAIVEVIGREVERARYMADPIANVGIGSAASASNVNAAVDDSTAGCIRMSYHLADPDRDAATTDAVNVGVAFNLKDEAVFVKSVATAAASAPVVPTCAQADVPVSSPDISVTAFRAEVIDDLDANANGKPDSDQLDSILLLQIDAVLAGDTSGLAITRTVSDRIRIGSSHLPGARD